jgi:hypothetical protein
MASVKRYIYGEFKLLAKPKLSVKPHKEPSAARQAEKATAEGAKKKAATAKTQAAANKCKRV